MAIMHLPRVGMCVVREVVLLGSAFPEKCVCVHNTSPFYAVGYGGPCLRFQDSAC